MKYVGANQMDKQSFSIGILSLSAVILLVANFFSPQPAQALNTIKDRSFSMVTASTQAGGDVLYVVDNQTGRLGIFAYDPARKELVPRAGSDLAAGFAGSGR
jgi:hypothetical protein